jgi:hypothetical protein
MASKPKPHLTKYTLVLSTYVRPFDTLEEAEKERDKALERGEIACCATAWCATLKDAHARRTKFQIVLSP